MKKTIFIFFFCAIFLSTNAQNCSGVIDTFTICGFEHSWQLQSNGEAFIAGCPTDNAHISLSQRVDTLTATVNQCGAYEVIHSYFDIAQNCTIEDTYILQFEDPSSQSIATQSNLDVTIKGEPPVVAPPTCENPTATITGGTPPSVCWSYCETIVKNTFLYTGNVIPPDVPTDCLVDSIFIHTDTTNEQLAYACNEFLQDDFYGVAGVDFFDFLETSATTDATFDLPASPCDFGEFIDYQTDTIIQEVTIYIPVVTGAGWALIHDEETLPLQDTTNLTFASDSNYILIVTPSADSINIEVELQYWNGTALVNPPQTQSIQLKYMEFRDSLIYTHADTTYLTSPAACGGLYTVSYGAGVPGFGDSPYGGPIEITFSGGCDCVEVYAHDDYVYADCYSYYDCITPSGSASDGLVIITPEIICYPGGSFTVTSVNSGCTATGFVYGDGYFDVPYVDIEGNSTLTCSSPCTTLDANTGGAGIIYYYWYNHLGIYLANQPTITVCEPGTYTLEVTSYNGCYNTASIEVVADTQPPSIVIEGNPYICVGDCTVLEVSGTAIEYEWSTQETTQSIQVCQGGTYAVTATADNGCTAVETMEVVVSEAFDVSIEGATIICEGTTTALQCMLHANGSFGYSYLWNTGETGQIITVSNPGCYHVTVYDEAGCYAEDEVCVSLLANPEPIIVSDTIECDELSTTLRLNASYTSYEWSTSENTATIEVTQSGTYAVTVTDAYGCTGETNIDIEISEPLELTATGGTLNCCNPQIMLSCNINSINAIFEWVGPGGFVSSEQNPVVDMPGTFTATATTPAGCTATATVVVVDEIIPLSVVAAPSDTLTCTQSEVQLLLIEIDNELEYQWNGPSNYESTLPEPTVAEAGLYTLSVLNPLTCCTTTTTVEVITDTVVPTIFVQNDTLTCEKTELIPLHISSDTSLLYQWGNEQEIISNGVSPILDAAGGYTVTVTNQTNGCSNTTTFEIAQLNTLEATFASYPSCAEAATGSIELVEISGGQSPYYIEWELLENGAYAFDNVAANSYAYELFDSGNCIKDGVITVEEEPISLSTIETEELVLCEGEKRILSPRTTLNIPAEATFSWNTGATTANIQISKGGEYEVAIHTGCEITILTYEVEERKESSLYIPTAFSPNGDGINDIFVPMSSRSISDYKLSIHDRWGNLLFLSTDETQGWDGTMAGTKANSGVFVYYLEAMIENCQGNLVLIDRYGSLTLLR